MKPEKVKSRWRRNSELECGDDGKTEMKSPDEFDETPLDSTSAPKMSAPASDDPRSPVVDKAVETEKPLENSLPQYEHLGENIFRFERKRCKNKKEVRRMLCDCILTKEEQERRVIGCDVECLNRLLMIECGSRCATGEACSNKRFQKKQYVKALPFKTDKKGWGLRALEDITSGTFVMEYVGEVLSRREFKQRVKQYAREKCDHHYFMALKSNEIIDATVKGNYSRFINHSCDPNCETQKWTVNGELRIGFFATKDVKNQEELTFDYKFQRYGREAQKCYCESENCSGFIGEAKQLSLDGGTPNKSASNKRKKSEDKKRSEFEDLMFSEEVEKICSNSGLRNREETLILARLMVRAEDIDTRLRLLDVILKTSEPAYLRLFLDYHGLSLIWSWMVDVTDPKLKFALLKVLTVLPITNKTVLLDSKVLSVVEKWCSDVPVCIEKTKEVEMTEFDGSSECPVRSDDMNFLSQDSDLEKSKRMKLSNTSDCEMDFAACSKFQTDIPSVLSEKQDESASNNGSKAIASVETLDISVSNKESPNESSTTSSAPKSDEESLDTPEDEQERKGEKDSELLNMAVKLLEDWKELKEVFRIPRVEKKDEPDADKREGDSVEDSESCSSENPTFDCASDSEIASKDNKVKRNSEKHCKNSFEKEGRSSKRSHDDHKPRKTLLPTPKTTNTLSKEERRHLFALEVKQRDLETMRKQQEADFYYEGAYPAPGTYPNFDLVAPTEDGSSPSKQRTTLLPTPIFPDHTQLAPVTYPPPGIAYPFPQQMPFLGGPPPNLAQPPPNIVPTPVNLPVLNPVQPVPGMVPVSNSLPHTQIPLASISTAPVSNAAPLTPGTVPITSLPPMTFPGQSSLPGPAYLPNSVPFVNAQNHPMIYVPPGTVMAEQPPTENHLALGDVVETVPVKRIRLPPNWKTAKDPEGNVYYYHSITRETQWDPPEYDEFEDEDSSTPTFDEPKVKRKTTTAAADTSSYLAIEVIKKIKELFRTKMSSFVVQTLNSYRKPDCAVGRITCTEDFKHLARKLTHFLMAKELKLCKNVEELDCNDHVKFKAKEFIKTYMAKFGPVYRKDKSSSPD